MPCKCSVQFGIPFKSKTSFFQRSRQNQDKGDIQYHCSSLESQPHQMHNQNQQSMTDINEIRKKASEWLGNEFDESTREEVQAMLDNDEKTLVDAFYQDLEFGTGGLRGIMGAGTNRMNRYTLGMATQGLSNYLIRQADNRSSVKVAIAYDCRNNSKYFAQVAADIFTANGFTAYLFESLRPTPELSYAIRLYNCDAGVVITASHNPKEYNGYKVSWNDGGQVVEPHDRGIIDEVRKIKSVSEIMTGGDPPRIIT